MKRRFSKEDEDLDQFNCKKSGNEEQSIEQPAKTGSKKKKDQKQEYKCGNPSCNKYYHSYTAFYNHCKKVHEGEFPQGSLVNNRPFEGPSKNRGRPRITKTQTKNDKEIQAMKSENELIEFLGTLTRGQKSDEIILYVENPLQHVMKAVDIARKWLVKTIGSHIQLTLLQNITRYNSYICEHDLPEFYDPIETELALDKVDSYSFTSIFKFMSDPRQRAKCSMAALDRETIKQLMVVWLGRVVSVQLLAEIIWAFAQERTGQEIIDKQKGMLEGRIKEFLEKVSKFAGCYHTVSEKLQVKIEE